jgi:uncharacterized alpha-E superfamily protein
MMLSRVADSLYWMGRYAERAEHNARLAVGLVDAALDRGEAYPQGFAIVAETLGSDLAPGPEATRTLVARLALDRTSLVSVMTSVGLARENARQVRDQITSEVWESLNGVHLRLGQADAARALARDPARYLQSLIQSLHLVTGAVEATMSHGEGWILLCVGRYLERAQLMAKMLGAGFGGLGRPVAVDHGALAAILRMGCALEPYLRAYTADIRPGPVLEFLMLDPVFPRSIRFCTETLHTHLRALGQAWPAGGSEPARLAGRLNADLAYARLEDVARVGAGELLGRVGRGCADLHTGIIEAYVAYPLEHRIPA